MGDGKKVGGGIDLGVGDVGEEEGVGVVGSVGEMGESER